MNNAVPPDVLKQIIANERLVFEGVERKFGTARALILGELANIHGLTASIPFVVTMMGPLVDHLAAEWGTTPREIAESLFALHDARHVNVVLPGHRRAPELPPAEVFASPHLEPGSNVVELNLKPKPPL